MARFAFGLFLGLLSLGLLFTSFASAQSDSQAIQYAQQAIAALTGGTTVTDVTISGNATRTVGSEVGTGTGTFYAKGLYESRLDLSLSNGSRSEIRNSTNTPQGEWLDSSGNPYQYSSFNCQTDAVWFFPTFSSLASATDSNQALTYVGLETLNGESVQHLHSVWFGQQLITTDFYLDATSLLPVAGNFNAHPDNDATTNIPVQALFMNYQNVNGVQVPYHIQELLNGTLLLDFTATSAVINSGLSDNLFTIQ
jgi:hypothetical protein